MKSIAITFVVSILFASSVRASDIGQPYECADWEILAPGLTCSQVGQWSEQGKVFGSDVIVDNAGRLLRVSLQPRPGYLCGQTQAYWIVLEASQGGTSTELLRLGDRCNSSIHMDAPLLPLQQGTMAFDPHAGRLYYFLAASVNGPVPPNRGSVDVGVGSQKTIFAFDGFATTFELQQTYEPPQSLSITVPARPEGLAGADRFDTYWGTLAPTIDLASAQPLHCAYPTGPASVGDRLEWPDPLQVPPPGTGYWYLTSVSYQGVTHAGRRALNGQLVGRDASLLPPCTE